MWLLTIEDDEGLTTYHRLSGERCALGRTPDNDVVLAQLNISRRHARLERRGSALYVSDLNSRSGTFLNGRRVLKSAEIADGDALQLGDYVVHFSRELSVLDLTPPPRYVVPARLRGLAGPVAGFEHVFARDEIVTIGRWDDCTLRIVREEIGPLFALVRPLPDGRHELVDEGGGGKLFVNGRPVFIAQVLEGGDAINLAGVALLRYLEPSQMPDPRFDQFWGEGVAPPPAEAPPLSLTPALLRPLPEGARGPVGRGAKLAGWGGGVEGLGGRGDAGGGSLAREFGELDLSEELEDVVDTLLPPRRVEHAGPLALPRAMIASASYRRLRQTTIGRRADSKGRERAVVVERVAAPPDDEVVPRPRRSFPSLHSPLEVPDAPLDAAGGGAHEGEFIQAGAGLLHTAPTPIRIERDPSGRLATAFEASVDSLEHEGAEPPSPGDLGDAAPEASGLPSSRRVSPRRPNATALYALTLGALGVVLGLRVLQSERGSSAQKGEVFGSAITPLLATMPAAGDQQMPEAQPLERPAAPPPQGPTERSAAPSPEGPSLVAQAAPHDARATQPQGASSSAPRSRAATGAALQGNAALAPGQPASGAGDRRSRLEARARSGRASADELRELMSLCQAAGNAACIALAAPLLRSADERP